MTTEIQFSDWFQLMTMTSVQYMVVWTNNW